MAGPMVLVHRLREAVDAGEVGQQQARLAFADTMLEACGAAEDFARPSTLRRSRAIRRRLGLVLAEGVIEEVELDVHAVLEAALETDKWERRG